MPALYALAFCSGRWLLWHAVEVAPKLAIIVAARVNSTPISSTEKPPHGEAESDSVRLDSGV